GWTSGAPARSANEFSSPLPPIPRTYAVLPSERMTRSFSVAMVVGAFCRPSGSITRGRERNGSIADGGMLGIPWSASDSARTRGESLDVLLGGTPPAGPAGPATGPAAGPPGAPDSAPEGAPPIDR